MTSALMVLLRIVCSIVNWLLFFQYLSRQMSLDQSTARVPHHIEYKRKVNSLPTTKNFSVPSAVTKKVDSTLVRPTKEADSMNRKSKTYSLGTKRVDGVLHWPDYIISPNCLNGKRAKILPCVSRAWIASTAKRVDPFETANDLTVFQNPTTYNVITIHC